MYYSRYVKRPLDLLIGTVFLIILSPVLILITILLFIANDGHPFFFQKRPGKGERIFEVIKFRTMNQRKDERGVLLPDAERLTAVGKFIRKTSLDEIPQLISVVKGDMALIGPRPLLVEYIPLYSDEQRRRSQVRPGITGWAQVNGRNSISWKDKFTYDVWYVDHISFWLDLKIIMMTFIKVIKAEGISGKGVATAEYFNGNN